MKEGRTLYIITGFPFSGKTTFSKEFADKTGNKHFPLDEFVQEYGVDIETISASEEQINLWRSEQDRRTREYLVHYSVNNDAINGTKSRRADLRKLAEKAGANVITVYIDTPLDVVTKRWQKNNESRERAIIFSNVFYQSIKAYEAPTDEEHIVFRSGVDDVPTWMKENAILFS